MNYDGNSIAHIGTDIAGQMLDALIKETSNEAHENVPTADKIKFLKKNINSLSTQDRKEIGDVLIINDKRSCIHECNEGSVINLDNVPENILTLMYEVMLFKLNKRK